MAIAFDAKNDLEKILILAQNGKITLDEFMNTLVESQVFTS